MKQCFWCLLHFYLFKVLKKNVSILDGRGKHGKQRRTSSASIDHVKQFIESIPKRESHYSQKDNSGVSYLDSTWNISRLYLEYLNSNPESQHPLVKPSTFRKIFHYDFNIRFGYPRTDKCATCELILIQMRRLKRPRRPDQAEIDRLLAELNEHHSNAHKFYSAMKEAKESDDSVFAFCMDFGSNLPLPVTNVGEEYYKRQLWIHNLAFHNLKSGQAYMFVYSEHFAEKGIVKSKKCYK